MTRVFCDMCGKDITNFPSYKIMNESYPNTEEYVNYDLCDDCHNYMNRLLSGLVMKSSRTGDDNHDSNRS